MHVTAIGRTRILYNAIRAMNDAGHEVERIVTCPAADFYDVTATDFRSIATALGADFLEPDNINNPDLVDIFERSNSEIAISANWKSLLGRSVLDAFPHGVLNAHAGDLPRYRGNAAPNWAIINGEDEVVLTIHRMTEELDAGPILAQRGVPLDDSTYIGDIYEEMFEEFPELFVDIVEAAAEGSLDPRSQSQDKSDHLRGYPRKPGDSELQWEQSADHLARVVRASSEPLFGAYTWLDGIKLRVWRAHAEEAEHAYLGAPGQVAHRRPERGEVVVVTGEDFLVLESVQREGVDRQRLEPAEVIDSPRARLGLDVATAIADLRAEVNELTDCCDELDDQS